jgi:protein-S-isoprenylcysteine O-methyltransferase Ste14
VSSEDARRRRLAWVAVAAQAVAIVGLLLGPGPWFSGPRWLTVLGVVLLLAGAGIALGGMTGLGRALTPTPVPVEGAGLRTGGLYRFVRHPIYAGVLLGAGGVVLCGPSPWRVAWWLVLLAVLLPKSAWEERMLAAEYADYPDYARRTGRFFPRIRKR